jgi:hypothetical protein
MGRGRYLGSSPCTLVVFEHRTVALAKRKKWGVVVVTNLGLGNAILWFFETAGRQQENPGGWALGFSLAALVALWLASRWIEPNQSPLRSTLLAACVSTFVVIVGLALSFAPAGPLKAVVFAVIAGTMFLGWSLPMVLMNAFLFHWVAKR